MTQDISFVALESEAFICASAALIYRLHFEYK